jgi:hypothetical protein
MHADAQTLDSHPLRHNALILQDIPPKEAIYPQSYPIRETLWAYLNWFDQHKGSLPAQIEAQAQRCDTAIRCICLNKGKAWPGLLASTARDLAELERLMSTQFGH